MKSISETNQSDCKNIEETNSSKLEPELNPETSSSFSENEADPPVAVSLISTPKLEYPDTHVKISYPNIDKYQIDSDQNEQVCCTICKKKSLHINIF